MNENTYLSHHGILGMKWGIRRFQNEDGSLTEAGKKRYGYDNIHGHSSEARKAAVKAATVGAAASVTADRIQEAAAEAYYYSQKPMMAPGANQALLDWTSSSAWQANTAKQFGQIAMAAGTVASIISGVGAVATISYGVVAAGQLAYTQYLKAQARKVQKETN